MYSWTAGAGGGDGRALFSTTMLAPKTHTQIPLPTLTRVKGMWRVQKKAGKLSKEKQGANYRLLKDRFFFFNFLIQNIYFLRGSEFQFEDMANTEGRLFPSLLGIFSSRSGFGKQLRKCGDGCTEADAAFTCALHRPYPLPTPTPQASEFFWHPQV